jgi:hypothetical protein
MVAEPSAGRTSIMMTVAPMSSPKDCATSCVSMTVAQFAKKAPADRLRKTWES